MPPLRRTPAADLTHMPASTLRKAPADVAALSIRASHMLGGQQQAQDRVGFEVFTPSGLRGSAGAESLSVPNQGPKVGSPVQMMDKANSSVIMEKLHAMDPAAAEAFISHLDDIDLTTASRVNSPRGPTAPGSPVKSPYNNSAAAAFGERTCEEPIPKSMVTPMSTFQENEEAYARAGVNSCEQGRSAIVLLAAASGKAVCSPSPRCLYDFGLPSHKCPMQLFCERIAKISFCSLREPDLKSQCDIPLYIMVLKHEEKEIRRLLELNDYFGLKPENVRIFHQPTLPCYDGAGQIAFACADPPRLASAPNGDGGVIGALTKGRHIANMADRGITHVHFLHADSILAIPADPTFVGFASTTKADCAVKVVQKEVLAAHQKAAEELFLKMGRGPTDLVQPVDIEKFLKTSPAGKPTSDAVARDSAQETLAKCDVNLDGRISLGEFLDAYQGEPHKVMCIDKTGSINCADVRRLPPSIPRSDFYHAGFVDEVVFSLPFLKKISELKIEPEMYHEVRTNIATDRGYVGGHRLELWLHDFFKYADNLQVLQVDPARYFAVLKNPEGHMVDSPMSCRESISVCHTRIVQNNLGKVAAPAAGQSNLLELSPILFCNSSVREDTFELEKQTAVDWDIKPPIQLAELTCSVLGCHYERIDFKSCLRCRNRSFAAQKRSLEKLQSFFGPRNTNPLNEVNESTTSS